MRKFRLPIWTLLALVLFFAVAFGVLKNPSESIASAVFSLVVLSLCVAPVVAVASTGRGRLAWLAFTLFGSAYLGLTFFSQVFPTPRFVPSGWVAAGLDRLEGMMDGNQPAVLATGTTFIGSGTIFRLDAKFVPQYPEVEKSIAFRQIGHGLAMPVFGLVAATIVLIMPAPKPADTHTSGGPPVPR